MPNSATVCVCGVYYTQLGLYARRICACTLVCALSHVQVHTWVWVRVWSSVCFLMCVSQHCSPLSSNHSSMLKPAVCPEIVREGEDGFSQIPPTTEAELIIQACNLSFFETHMTVYYMSFIKQTGSAVWLKCTSFLQEYTFKGGLGKQKKKR